MAKIKDTDFNMLNPIIRIREKNLIDRPHMEALSAAATLKECADVLKDTIYRNFVQNADFEADCEGFLCAQWEELYGEMYERTPAKEIVDLFALRFDYHNIKMLIKQEQSGKNLESSLIEQGAYPLSEIRTAVLTGTSEIIPEKTLALIREIRESEAGKKEVVEGDMAMDRRYLSHLRELADSTGFPEVSEYVKTYIDLKHLSMMARCAAQNRDPAFLDLLLAEGGGITITEWKALYTTDKKQFAKNMEKTPYKSLFERCVTAHGNFSSALLDKEIDNFLLKKLREAKFEIFGPKPLMAFIYAKEIELKNLRIILAGKKSELERQKITERVRNLYVL